MNQEILVVSSDRDEGLLFFNVDNCEIIASIKFGPKDDLYSQGIIQRLNLVVSGSITGMVRLIDMTKKDAF